MIMCRMYAEYTGFVTICCETCFSLFMCMAVYNSYIDVPDNLTFEEAIDYANGHTGDIPLGKLDYVRDVGTLTKFNCAFDS